MTDGIQPKRSFWHFGGKLDTTYNWIVGTFFVLSCFVQVGRNKDRLPEGLGAAFGQTVFVAVVLFVLFKIISSPRKS